MIPQAPRRKGRCTNSALANSSPRERRSSDQSLAPGALEQTCGATISSYGVDPMVFWSFLGWSMVESLHGAEKNDSIHFKPKNARWDWMFFRQRHA